MPEPRPPIEKLLDTVDWKELPPPGLRMRERGLPVATHEGILRLDDSIELRCFQLDDGHRVFDAASVATLFGAFKDGDDV